MCSGALLEVEKGGTSGAVGAGEQKGSSSVVRDEVGRSRGIGSGRSGILLVVLRLFWRFDAVARGVGSGLLVFMVVLFSCCMLGPAPGLAEVSEVRGERRSPEAGVVCCMKEYNQHLGQKIE